MTHDFKNGGFYLNIKLPFFYKKYRKREKAHDKEEAKTVYVQGTKNKRISHTSRCIGMRYKNFNAIHLF